MSFDVIVVGGGHAGVEAADAAARRGARVALIAFDLDRIGILSCNPSIGGIGKGHLVREVDALDGVMARAADAAAIHYRMLNRAKGAAVHGPRLQADRRLYREAIWQRLAGNARITLVAGEAVDLRIAGGRLAGAVLADGSTIDGRTVVLATGTFLGARMFRGAARETGGRIGERAATRLADRLRDLGLPLARLKTGTPPRLDGRTIDWAALARQPSDTIAWTMSPLTPARANPQLACALTRTTPQTHELIRANLDRSPLHGGAITGQGPRYCPSIEDKIRRFGDRDGHQIFLEPEGLDDATVYPNGISTSLPDDVQAAMIESIPGLERTRITMPGYAVEYDHVDPRALDRRLGLAAIPGVYLAGQVNGTTGYEEAAAQGLVAGANAAAEALALAPFVPDRTTSYIGVMIDDLVLQGVAEPYRMLTARSEFRLALRADNAERRLHASGREAGLLGAERLRFQEARLDALDRIAESLSPHAAAIRAGASPELPDAPEDLRATAIEDIRYAPYVERQASEIAAMRDAGGVAIASDFAFADVPGLSNEMIERLSASRPGSIDEASRVPGVTPAALTALWLHRKARGR